MRNKRFRAAEKTVNRVVAQYKKVAKDRHKYPGLFLALQEEHDFFRMKEEMETFVLYGAGHDVAEVEAEKCDKAMQWAKTWDMEVRRAHERFVKENPKKRGRK